MTISTTQNKENTMTTATATRKVKKNEAIDTYDDKTRFNPFLIWD